MKFLYIPKGVILKKLQLFLKYRLMQTSNKYNIIYNISIKYSKFSNPKNFNVKDIFEFYRFTLIIHSGRK